MLSPPRFRFFTNPPMQVGTTASTAATDTTIEAPEGVTVVEDITEEADSTDLGHSMRIMLGGVVHTAEYKEDHHLAVVL